MQDKGHVFCLFSMVATHLLVAHHAAACVGSLLSLMRLTTFLIWSKYPRVCLDWGGLCYGLISEKCNAYWLQIGFAQVCFGSSPK